MKNIFNKYLKIHKANTLRVEKDEKTNKKINLKEKET
jgi:hypothetical protein